MSVTLLNAICLKEAAGNEGGAKDPVQKQEEKTSGYVQIQQIPGV